MTSLRLKIFATVLATLALAAPALAHVSLSGQGIADSSQVLTFSVGHGCEGADTVKLEIAIPDAVTTVRALPGPFGDAVLTTDDAGLVRSVSWSKAEARAADDQYYQLAIRIKVPNAPFTRLYFPTTQTCRTADGDELVVEWAALPTSGDEAEPAPELLVLPPHKPGWNRYTVDVAIDDLTMFDDALIVWAGERAYSSNPETAALIEGTEDVEPLTAIEAGAEIWVKY